MKKLILLIVIALITFFLVAALVFAHYIRWSWKVEDYCVKRASEVIGGMENWTAKTFPAEPEEFPYVGKGGIIYQGFREQLKCERDPQTLEKFKRWF